MEDYKVKIEIIDNKDKVVGSTTIDCKTIEELHDLHDTSMLDVAYYQLLLEIRP